MQAATNGTEFAKSFEFCQQAVEAGMRYAYLQFDGIGNAANAHRMVGNLFDVKLKAIENLDKAGVEIVPVVTIVNGINNEQVGDNQVRPRQPKDHQLPKLPARSFTGRDEAVTDDCRQAQRYTLSHLAHDVKNETGLGEPSPTGSQFLHGNIQRLGRPDARQPRKKRLGPIKSGRHPNCGTGTAVMIDKETKEAVPVTAFLAGDQIAKDIAKVNDAARGKFYCGGDGVVFDEELRSLSGAYALQADGSAVEV